MKIRFASVRSRLAARNLALSAGATSQSAHKCNLVINDVKSRRDSVLLLRLSVSKDNSDGRFAIATDCQQPPPACTGTAPALSDGGIGGDPCLPLCIHSAQAAVRFESSDRAGRAGRNDRLAQPLAAANPQRNPEALSNHAKADKDLVPEKP